MTMPMTRNDPNPFAPPGGGWGTSPAPTGAYTPKQPYPTLGDIGTGKNDLWGGGGGWAPGEMPGGVGKGRLGFDDPLNGGGLPPIGGGPIADPFPSSPGLGDKPMPPFNPSPMPPEPWSGPPPVIGGPGSALQPAQPGGYSPWQSSPGGQEPLLKPMPFNPNPMPPTADAGYTTGTEYGKQVPVWNQNPMPATTGGNMSPQPSQTGYNAPRRPGMAPGGLRGGNTVFGDSNRPYAGFGRRGRQGY